MFILFIIKYIIELFLIQFKILYPKNIYIYKYKYYREVKFSKIILLIIIYEYKRYI